MILLPALVAGLWAGWALSRWRGYQYQPPKLQSLWLVFAAVIPQIIVLYLPTFPKWLAAGCLLTSQIMLLGFAWLNRHILGMSILICGVALNLAVMAANSGFMPISPQTASRLVSEDRLLNIQPTSRFGAKDILLHSEDTRFEWLADRFLLPTWFPYQVAFSLGDVFIALGAFLLLAKPKSFIQFTKRGAPI